MNDIAYKPIVKNTILSDAYEVFTQDDSKDLAPWIDVSKNNVPELFKNYEYPVSSWPVIINQRIGNELNQLSIKLPQLIAQILELYFDNDTKRIADFYFGGNEMIAQFALMCHNKMVDIGCRLDLTYTKDGFKVLEVNTGSSIGGWQVQSFESIIRRLHTPLGDSDVVHKYKAKNTQVLYIRFLIDKIVQYVSNIDKEINVFFCIKESLGTELRDNSIVFFDELLQEELSKRGMNGRAISGDVSALKLVDGDLVLGDKNIHGVLILSLDEGKEIPPDLFRAFIMDKIYFPDHLGVSILGDKRNLSLLRELAMKNSFSPEDNELILKSIPWTAIVEKGNLMYQDKEYELSNLLIEYKDQFVIKDANGYQGKDVFIGKFSTDKEWEEALYSSLGNNNFIAQEFSDSLDFLAPDITNEWAPHKLIWGSFGFGKEYGGVWVRMSAVKTDVGVINSATGAVEAIVYESIS